MSSDNRGGPERVGPVAGETVISVRKVGKSFLVYDHPADRLRQFVMPRIQRLARRPERQYFGEFHALEDVSFEVTRGETLGIVGRNGSGKSTLLQIICGTLTPSRGHVETRGRIAALLELGSGFNPEFSGRENVYLNAALLGLSRQEVDERFDRIAAFADIGPHLDHPVKTYSSGMFVRLAFAVIAHVDADVLVIDEALSVGDAVFTQRCMRFIRRFQEQGTLLFVSHDTSAVRNLCQRAIWLSRGRLIRQGPSKEVSNAYLQASLQELYGSEEELREEQSVVQELEGGAVGDMEAAVPESGASRWAEAVDGSVVRHGGELRVLDNRKHAAGFGTGKAKVDAVELCVLNAGGSPPGVAGGAAVVLRGGERVRLRIKARASIDLDAPILGFIFKDRLGQDLFGENTLSLRIDQTAQFKAGQPFEADFIFRLPMLPNGEYSVMASVANGTLFDHVQHHYLHDALVLTVSSSQVRWGLVGIPFERISLHADPAGHE